MKKLTLRVEALAVESFPVGHAAREAGTVHGQELRPTPPYLCPGWSKPTDCPCTPIV